MTSAKNKKVATVTNPSIEAVVNGLYRLPNEELALKKLEAIKNSFITSKTEEEAPLTLWIKGYEVTGREAKEGCTGNFAIVEVVEIESGIFTLRAEKQAVPLNKHPQKKRRKQRFPNWGHPVLREVRKEKTYTDIESAAARLENLHENYPEATIPTQNKLYVMIFSRAEDKNNPVQKYILEIKPSKEKAGEYFIDCQKNTRKPRKTGNISDGDSKGYFTSMVNLKRSGKKNTENTGG